jgi:phosphoserine phosphatase
MKPEADLNARLRLALAALLLALAALLLAPILAFAETDALPSWNDGAAKQAILAFVARTTIQGSPDFVPIPERIATFDNDGTLWAEQSIYFQFAFALDRVEELAPQHPEWKTTQPFKAALEGDRKALAAEGARGLVKLVMAMHTGMSTEEFAGIVSGWMQSARHPRFKRPYTDLVYQPMLELLAYLRANGFKTYIVSGGTVEFMRTWSEQIYGIPPEQVIGTTFVTRFQAGKNSKPVLIREPKVDFIDDGSGKPVAINKFIGRHPMFAFGNSDGDLQMLQWTAAGSGEREWAYDRQSPIGRLDKALDEAKAKGWIVVDMKKDWKRIFLSLSEKEQGRSSICKENRDDDDRISLCRPQDGIPGKLAASGQAAAPAHDVDCRRRVHHGIRYTLS